MKLTITTTYQVLDDNDNVVLSHNASTEDECNGIGDMENITIRHEEKEGAIERLLMRDINTIHIAAEELKKNNEFSDMSGASDEFMLANSR